MIRFVDRTIQQLARTRDAIIDETSCLTDLLQVQPELPVMNNLEPFFGGEMAVLEQGLGPIRKSGEGFILGLGTRLTRVAANAVLSAR